MVILKQLTVHHGVWTLKFAAQRHRGKEVDQVAALVNCVVVRCNTQKAQRCASQSASGAN